VPLDVIVGGISMLNVVRRGRWAFLVALALSLADRSALAGPKEECLDAHSRGQTERDKGQLSKARQSFTACAQSSCPSVVQADCARSSEDMTHMIPTVTFVARDATAADLPATSVFVDDVLVATRLDDGKSYDVDPGKHVVRYVHDSRETTIRVVLNQGEKGRVLVATFGGPTPAAAHHSSDTFEPVSEQKRSTIPLAVAGLGAAATLTGAVILGVGLSRVPSSCEISTHECSTPPNDPALAEAQSGMSLANAGMGIGIAGAAFLVGGLVWYVLQRPRPTETRRGRIDVPFRFSF
jgi:hypothetical protein